MSDLYDKIVNAFPEPGLKEDAVRHMVRTAQETSVFSEGLVGYLSQMTAEMLRGILGRQHTYHESIDDFAFAARALKSIQK